MTQETLAELTGELSQSQISMFETGVRARPSYSYVAMIAKALRLDATDTNELFESAGLASGNALEDVPLMLPPDAGSNSISLEASGTQADYCRVYSYRYGPQSFPTAWDMRILELERQVPGNLDLMIDYVPALTHNSQYLRHSYHKSFYPSHRIHEYSLVVEARRRAMERRLRSHRIRHIYPVETFHNYLKSYSYDKGNNNIPYDVRCTQLATLLHFLEHHNYAMGLTELKLPLIYQVIGNEFVMIETNRTTDKSPLLGVLGVEIVDKYSADQFVEQFDNIWNNSSTITGKRRINAAIREWMLDFRPRS